MIVTFFNHKIIINRSLLLIAWLKNDYKRRIVKQKGDKNYEWFCNFVRPLVVFQILLILIFIFENLKFCSKKSLEIARESVIINKMTWKMYQNDGLNEKKRII